MLGRLSGERKGTCVTNASLPFAAEGWAIGEVLGGSVACSLGDTRRLMGRVVHEVLVPRAAVGAPAGALDIGSEAARLRFRVLWEAAAVLDFLTHAHRMLGQHDRKEAGRVGAFIDRLAADDLGLLPEGPLWAWQHGDFHARNVLVGDDARPLLVDVAKACVLPRLFDFATLQIDTMMRVLDGGCGEDWDWSKLNL
jgi:hypothetical protein